ncbi:hypothetical protein ACSMXN_14085 [Jatrophihabitans sp. DSM 45814]
MTDGEAARTVIAILEADLDGELNAERFANILEAPVTLETMAIMFGHAVAIFTALGERFPHAAREILDRHREASFGVERSG